MTEAWARARVKKLLSSSSRSQAESPELIAALKALSLFYCGRSENVVSAPSRATSGAPEAAHTTANANTNANVVSSPASALQRRRVSEPASSPSLAAAVTVDGSSRLYNTPDSRRNLPSILEKKHVSTNTSLLEAFSQFQKVRTDVRTYVHMHTHEECVAVHMYCTRMFVRCVRVCAYDLRGLISSVCSVALLSRS